MLDECVLEILRCAQDDKTPGCHPERSEGSLADFWGITSYKAATDDGSVYSASPRQYYRYTFRVKGGITTSLSYVVVRLSRLFTFT